MPMLVHKDTKITVTEATADLGIFSAIAAAWTVDHHRDQIKPGAFAESIKRWRARKRTIPVHWNHSGEARNIIGRVDPASMRETQEGLLVEGWLDLDHSAVAREAWRAMKSNAISLSFGFKIDREFKRDDGIRELYEVDLFEISLVPIPANPDARVLSMKSVRQPIQIASFEC